MGRRRRGGVITAWAAPVVLLPFSSASLPVTDGPLRQRLMALAASAGVSALGVFEWHTSDRTFAGECRAHGHWPAPGGSSFPTHC